VSSQFTNDNEVTKVLKSKDMFTFWADLQGGIPVAFGNGILGVHAGGHFTINGDPGSDFATSAGDPYFYFHHGQVDRTWWIWQNQDPATRTNALAGTIVLNDLTAPATQLTDKMNLGYAWPGEITIAETMSTMGGPFCYTYV
jgi:tyrosinase